MRNAGFSGLIIVTHTLMVCCPGEEIGNPILYGVLDAAGCTVQTSFQDFCFILLVYTELEIALADRAAENGEKGASHT
jgi:hypothetical protein